MRIRRKKGQDQTPRVVVVKRNGQRYGESREAMEIKSKLRKELEKL